MRHFVKLWIVLCTFYKMSLKSGILAKGAVSSNISVI